MKNDAPKSSIWDGLEPKKKEITTHTDVSTHTHEYTHDDTHTPKIRERKTARIQILTYPSIVEKLDHYARNHGLSRAEAFERAVSEFLENNT